MIKNQVYHIRGVPVLILHVGPYRVDCVVQDHGYVDGPQVGSRLSAYRHHFDECNEENIDE